MTLLSLVVIEVEESLGTRRVSENGNMNYRSDLLVNSNLTVLSETSPIFHINNFTIGQESYFHLIISSHPAPFLYTLSKIPTPKDLQARSAIRDAAPHGRSL